MNRRRGKRLLLAVAIAAVVAGGAMAAVTAARTTAPRHNGASARHNGTSVLVAAADYLGASPAQLRDQLRSGKSLAQIADATAGKSEAGLIEAIEGTRKEKLSPTAAARLAARVTATVDKVRGRRQALLIAAARYLGLGTGQLRSDLRAGKSLAQIADATASSSEAGLIEAIVTARKAALTAKVQSGAITQARADASVPKLVRRVRIRVNRVGRARG